MSPKHLKKAVIDALEAWGIRLPGTQGGRPGKALSVYLPLEGGQRIHVGTLSIDDDEWLFEYSGAFKARQDLPPIPDFPDKQRPYRSEKLWPFFEVRIPPVARPDVELILKAKRLAAEDVFAVLAELGRQTLASPYQLESKQA